MSRRTVFVRVEGDAPHQGVWAQQPQPQRLGSPRLAPLVVGDGLATHPHRYAVDLLHRVDVVFDVRHLGGGRTDVFARDNTEPPRTRPHSAKGSAAPSRPGCQGSLFRPASPSRPG